jgi:hypothetical protein
MNSLIQLNRQLRFLLITLMFACFAIAQSAQAVSPEADEDSPNVNTAQEDNAVLDLSSVTGNAATAIVTPTATPVEKYIVKEVKPNKWEIRIDLTRYVMCAMENVRFRGELHIAFNDGGGSVTVSNVILKGTAPGKPFSALGTGKKPTLGRTYFLINDEGFCRKDTGSSNNGRGSGIIRRKFEFKAKSNLPGKRVQFAIHFIVPYEFKGGKVTALDSDPFKIVCNTECN